VSDCPLVLKANTPSKSKAAATKRIKTVTMKGYRVAEPGLEEQHLEFTLYLYWDVEFHDGFKKPWALPLAIEKG
jgi:hypothetical protein